MIEFDLSQYQIFVILLICISAEFPAYNANDYASTLTPPQPSTKYNNKQVNTDMPHQHEYDDEHTDTTHPSQPML